MNNVPELEFLNIVQKISGHIKNPMTLEEVIIELKNEEYSPELLLQHVLLILSKNLARA